MLAAVYPSASANARSTTGFSAFKVQNPSAASTGQAGFYECLLEDNGAVFNDCGLLVNLVFDLPIDNTGTHTITVQPYWGNSSPNLSPPAGPTPFNCQAYAYAGNSSVSVVGTAVTFSLGGAGQTLTVDVPSDAMSMAVICWKVPDGEGIANINWNP
jgi:hypothetical protein